MRISRNKAHLLVGLTQAEAQMIGHVRVFASISDSDSNHWVSIKGDPQGNRSVSNQPGSSQHPFMVVVGRVTDIPLFGAEDVATRFKDGVLYGAKPKMDRPHKAKRVVEHRPQLPLTEMPGLAEFRQAVLIINNMRRTYGDQLEMQIEDGVLKVRLLLEL